MTHNFFLINQSSLLQVLKEKIQLANCTDNSKKAHFAHLEKEGSIKIPKDSKSIISNFLIRSSSIYQEQVYYTFIYLKSIIYNSMFLFVFINTVLRGRPVQHFIRSYISQTYLLSPTKTVLYKACLITINTKQLKKM